MSNNDYRTNKNVLPVVRVVAVFARPTATDGYSFGPPPRGSVLRYVTTNPGKVREAERYLPDGSVERLDFDYPEIQADELGPIAARGAREAYRHAGGPVLVDDAGLFVEGLDGFPGPYSSYVEETLGIERVHEIATDLDDRRAAFRCVLGYCDGDGFAASPDPVDRGDRNAAAAAGPDADGGEGGVSERGDEGGTDDQTGDAEPLPVKLFEGYVPGRIVAPRGDGGFGYDPIFEHDGETFAEMDTDRKNAVSHRGRALEKFAEWYADR
jgi:XTP/dITP diphosphohydrolase